ncbi:MAG: flagellar brake protein [bacterium]
MSPSHRSDKQIDLQDALKHLLPGTRLNIEIYEGPFRGIVSAVLFEKDDQSLRVGYPSYQGHPLPMRREAGVTISYPVSDGFLSLPGWIETIVKDPGPGLVLRLSRKGGMWTHERRFKRMPASIPFVYRRIDRRELLAYAGRTENISGNGFMFQTRRNLPMGTRLNIHLKIPTETLPLAVIGRVVRVSAKDPGRSRMQSVSLTFDEIALQDQDTVVRYIFTLERKKSASES